MTDQFLKFTLYALVFWSALPGRATTLTSAESQSKSENVFGQYLQLEEQAIKNDVEQNHSRFFPEVGFNFKNISEEKTKDLERGTKQFINLDWNLFNGGFDVSELKIKKLEGKIQNIELKQKKNTVLLSYFQDIQSLRMNEKLLMILQEARSSLKEIAVIEERRIKAGLGSPAEQLQVSIIQDELELEARETEGNFEVLKAKLLQYQGLELPKLQSSYDNDPNALTLSAQKFESRLELAQQKVSASSSEFWPKVSLNGRYGKLIADENQTGYSTTLLFSWNVFRGRRDILEQQKQKALALAEQFHIEWERRELKAQIESGIKSFANLDSRATAADAISRKAKSLLTEAMKEFKRGALSPVDASEQVVRYFESHKKAQSIALEKDINAFQRQLELNKTDHFDF